MDTLYTPELEAGSRHIGISGEEFKHARALRLQIGEVVLAVNGRGLAAICRVDDVQKNSLGLVVENPEPERGEPTQRRILALGILQQRERFEFALEKATELGISDFIPLQCRYSQRMDVKHARLESKALAAMKQSQRCRLPRIHPPMPPAGLGEVIAPDTTLLLCDAKGEAKPLSGNGAFCVIVGPEGGFSAEEISLLQQNASTRMLALGSRRLRAETAAIVALGLLGG